MGSELPGGYSTVITRPSLPGHLVRSFDTSCVTFASCANSVLDMRQAEAKITFVKVINQPFPLAMLLQGPRVSAATAPTPPSQFVLRAESARFRNGSRRVARSCPEAVFSR